MPLTRPLLAAAVAVVSAASIIAVAQAAKRLPRALLPDLVQARPSALDLRVVEAPEGPIFRLGFRSAVSNEGTGPLLLRGRRSSTAVPAMSVEQIVRNERGPSRRRARVGVVQYTLSPDHAHWHLLRFERYELRGADARTVVADQKSGFCVGDRYDAAVGAITRRKPSFPPPWWRRECGRGRPDLLSVSEGLSVGWGDNYEAHLEGQHLDLNGLPAGEYDLVHRVNVDRRLLESRYDNNAACLRIRLSWPGGAAAAPALEELPAGRCA